MATDTLERIALGMAGAGWLALSVGLALYALWLGVAVGGAILMTSGGVLVARANQGGDA